MPVRIADDFAGWILDRLSPFRRPSIETAPTNAKAGCLYPNNGRAILEAKQRGFENALVLDMLGNVAETGTSNIFLVKDGHVATPAANGSFLSGITRSRTISLLGDYGFRTTERTLTVQDFMEADEIFSTGNHSKVVPITRIEGRDLQPGPVTKRARELYWDWAHSTSADDSLAARPFGRAKGRSKSFNLCIVLSENRFRFSDRCIR